MKKTILIKCRHCKRKWVTQRGIKQFYQCGKCRKYTSFKDAKAQTL